MPNFVFYQIKLVKSQITSTVTERDVPIEEAQKVFSSFFAPSTRLPIFSIEGNGSQTIYENAVMAEFDDIALLRLNNKLSKSLVKKAGTTPDGLDKYENTQEESLPYCMVIIDNRPGKLIMAIEKSASWKSNTSRVRDILQQSLSKELQQRYCIDIVIDEITIPMKIWDLCEKVCKDNKDYINRITFHVRNPKKMVPFGTPKPSLIQEMERRIALTNAYEASLNMNYNNGDPSVMKNTMDDFVNLAMICTQQEYTLSIGFKNFGTYKCGEDVAFQRELGQLVLDSMAPKIVVMKEGSLSNWIDESLTMIEELKHAAEIPENRHR